jgi:hypothetical protein
VFGTFAEACGAQWAAKSWCMVSMLEKARRPSARTVADGEGHPNARTNNVSLILSAAAEGGRFEGVTLNAHIAADLSRIALAGGAGYPSALPIAWLKVRCCPEGSIPTNWPVHIDRDLIPCSIGIYPLYDRCGGRAEEKPNGLCS